MVRTRQLILILMAVCKGWSGSGVVVCPVGPMPPGGSLAPLDNYYFLDTQKIFIPIVPTTQAEHIVVPTKPNQICIKEQNILLKTQ